MDCLHLGHLLKEVFKIDLFPINVYGDNKSSIVVAQGNGKNASTRYLGTKYFAMKQLIKEGLIKIHYVPSKENRSDGMTKSLPLPSFKKFQEYCCSWFAENLFNNKMGNAICKKQHVEDCVTDDRKSSRGEEGSREQRTGICKTQHVEACVTEDEKRSRGEESSREQRTPISLDVQ